MKDENTGVCDAVREPKEKLSRAEVSASEVYIEESEGKRDTRNIRYHTE